MYLDSKCSRAIGVLAGCISFIVYVLYQHANHYRHFEQVETYPQIYDELRINKENVPTSKYLTVATSTWPFVVTYQFFWALYSLITIVRWKSLQILPIHFYGLWCLACCFDIGSFFLAAESNLLLSWSLACAAVLSRYGCLFFAFDGLFEFLAAHKGVHRHPSRFDMFCQWALLQNGLLCFQAWSSFTISIMFSSVLQHAFNASQTVAHCVSLLILGMAIIIWFVVQNFFIEKYTRFTIAEYVTSVIILGMFFGHCRSKANGTFAFSLILLCLTVIICIFRGCLIFYSEGKRKYATDDELEFMT